MHYLSSIKNRRYILLFILVIIVVAILSGTIAYIDSKLNITTTSVPGSDLKEFPSLESNINNLKIATSSLPFSNRIVQKINVLSDTKQKPEVRYLALANIAAFTSYLYSTNNNPAYKAIFPELDKFARENFPEQYKKMDFYQTCQDPTCADSQQPTEIQNIIKEINNSNLDNHAKEILTHSLLDAGYINSKDLNSEKNKFDLYFNVLQILNKNYKNEPNIPQISNELENFISQKYPNEYKSVNK